MGKNLKKRENCEQIQNQEGSFTLSLFTDRAGYASVHAAVKSELIILKIHKSSALALFLYNCTFENCEVSFACRFDSLATQVMVLVGNILTTFQTAYLLSAHEL